MKYFCLPADFKAGTVDAYAELNQCFPRSKVSETYGQLAPDTLFGSCRASSQLPAVDREKLEQYVRYCLDKGMEFNYVVNATSMENDELTKAGYQKLRDFFRQLVEMGVTSVTVALPSVMEIARYAAPKLNIKASTVCQINSPMKAEFYENLGIRRLVLDEDIYRRFDVLKSIRQVFTGDLEVIVNSFCVMDCPYKMFHYNSLSFSHLEKEMGAYYSPRCRSQHMGVDSFLKLAWIRPEDLHYYEDIGIQYFKIQGRTNVYYGNPVKALEYYMKESYDGDLVKLLELFSEKRLLNIADLEVDNRKLEGFFGKFVHSPESCKKLCSECGYCRSFAESAISPTDRMLVGMMQAMGGCILENFPVSLE